MSEYRQVKLILTIPKDIEHVRLARKLQSASFTSEPIVIYADGVSADAWVHEFGYGNEGAFNDD